MMGSPKGKYRVRTGKKLFKCNLASLGRRKTGGYQSHSISSFIASFHRGSTRKINPSVNTLAFDVFVNQEFWRFWTHDTT